MKLTKEYVRNIIAEEMARMNETARPSTISEQQEIFLKKVIREEITAVINEQLDEAGIGKKIAPWLAAGALAGAGGYKAGQQAVRTREVPAASQQGFDKGQQEYIKSLVARGDKEAVKRIIVARFESVPEDALAYVIASATCEGEFCNIKSKFEQVKQSTTNDELGGGIASKFVELIMNNAIKYDIVSDEIQFFDSANQDKKEIAVDKLKRADINQMLEDDTTMIRQRYAEKNKVGGKEDIEDVELPADGEDDEESSEFELPPDEDEDDEGSDLMPDDEEESDGSDEEVEIPGTGITTTKDIAKKIDPSKIKALTK